MELRQIEYFCTISELENFTRTAEVLHVSQPSVTKAIKSLESELRLTLIDRSQKHIALTEEGKVFLLHAKKIMRAVDGARKAMQQFHVHAGGTVHFGMPPMVESYLFPSFFMKFQSAHPDIALDVQEFSDSSEVRERTADGSLDFGIVLEELGRRSEESLLLMRDRMSLCIAKDHPLAGRDQVSFDELRKEKFILQQPSTYQYRQVLEHCMQSGYMPDIVLCTSQLKTIKELVANAMGVSVLPSFVTRAETDFCQKPLVPTINVQISLAWSAYKRQSAINELFMGFVKQYTETQEFKQQFHSAGSNPRRKEVQPCS